MPQEPAQTEAAQFFRSMEALVLAIFGTAWILFSIQLLNLQFMWLVFAALASVFAIIPASLNVLRALRATPRERSVSHQRASLVFNLIQVFQCALILFSAWYLPHIGHSVWTITVIALIMGLHLLPIAHLTQFSSFYVVGILVILVAIAGPHIFPGQIRAAGWLGLATGFLLWIGDFLVFTATN